MKNIWVGLAFVLFGGYRGYIGGWLEAALYISVGIGFGLMGIVKIEGFERYKKQIDIASWIFVGLGVILFIALLRSDAYGW